VNALRIVRWVPYRPSTIMNTARTVRWGVLGVADIAVRRVIPAIRATSNNTVVAIASRDTARAQSVAASLGIARAYGTYLDLLGDEGVDAVYIPLPNSLHAEWTVRSAEHGKHVLCEKPMAPTVAECEQMVAACRQAGVTFMEGFMYRFHPQHARVRSLIAAGMIGEVRLMRASFCVRMQRPRSDIRFSAKLAGGALMDVGVYAIDAVRWLQAADPVSLVGSTVLDRPASDPTSDGAEPSTRAAESDGRPADPRGLVAEPSRVTAEPSLRAVDLSAAATLTFPSGVLAVVTCSFVAAGGGTYEVLGTSGKITVHQAFAQPPGSPPRVTWDTADGPHEEVFAPDIDQHTLMFESFASCLVTGTQMPIQDDAGIGNIRVIEALRHPSS
jgi:predicted dehydrogenase